MSTSIRTEPKKGFQSISLKNCCLGLVRILAAALASEKPEMCCISIACDARDTRSFAIAVGTSCQLASQNTVSAQDRTSVEFVEK